MAYQRDPRKQFVPIQTPAGPQRRAERVHPARLQRPVRLPARGPRRRRLLGSRPVRLSATGARPAGDGRTGAPARPGPAGSARARRFDGRRGVTGAEVGPERGGELPGRGAAAACRAGAVRRSTAARYAQPGTPGGGGGLVTAATSRPQLPGQPGPGRLAICRLRARYCRTARASVVVEPGQVQGGRPAGQRRHDRGPSPRLPASAFVDHHGAGDQVAEPLAAAGR